MTNPLHRPLRSAFILATAVLSTQFATGPVEARLGLSKDRCDAIYGAPVKKNLDGSFLYTDGSFAYVVFFAAGVCDELFVLKPDTKSDGEQKLELATDDVARFLDENRPTPGHSWSPVEMQVGNGMGWKTDDGKYEAYLLPGGEQMNLSTSVAATARRMDLPRVASAPKTGTAVNSFAPESTGDAPNPKSVPTIFSEDEMTYYHLAHSARKINDQKTVINALKSLYNLIREDAEDDAEAANQRFGYFFSWLGDAYDQNGNALMATRCYHRFLEQFPLDSSELKTSVAVANNLTWLLATHVDPEIRAPKVAFQYAQELEKRADLPDPCHDTIAVAYAAVGRFKEALAKLVIAAESTRDPDLLRVLSQHRKLFQENTPYVEDR
jgi:hypothetical protein